jgi:hypothetical protein
MVGPMIGQTVALRGFLGFTPLALLIAFAAGLGACGSAHMTRHEGRLIVEIAACLIHHPRPSTSAALIDRRGRAVEDPGLNEERGIAGLRRWSCGS